MGIRGIEGTVHFSRACLSVVVQLHRGCSLGHLCNTLRGEELQGLSASNIVTQWNNFAKEDAGPFEAPTQKSVHSTSRKHCMRRAVQWQCMRDDRTTACRSSNVTRLQPSLKHICFQRTLWPCHLCVRILNILHGDRCFRNNL